MAKAEKQKTTKFRMQIETGLTTNTFFEDGSKQNEKVLTVLKTASHLYQNYY